jgi:hypothetical protein
MKPMTNQRHAPNSHVEDYPAPEPSIPVTHDNFELTEDTVVIYRREDPEQWILAEEAVRCRDRR